MSDGSRRWRPYLRQDEASWVQERRESAIEAVECGWVPRTSAETLEKNSGYASLATGPNLSAPSPMQLDFWTLPMAAAWFIWRSTDAVLHQTAAARIGWMVWERDGEEKVYDRPFFKCRLLKIGPARLWRVFSEAVSDSQLRYKDPPPNHPLEIRSNPSADLPYRRFKRALLSGKMKATYLLDDTQTRKSKSPEYWQDVFERYEQWIPGQPPINVPEEYCIPREAVITAEAEIAKRELDDPAVGLEQALGWVAYQDEQIFRSLSRADIGGRTYYGQRYEHAFKVNRPAKKLFDALVEGRLRGYRKNIELKRPDRLKLNSIWDTQDVKFIRADLKYIWPGQSTSATYKQAEASGLPQATSQSGCDSAERPQRVSARVVIESDPASNLSHTNSPPPMEGAARRASTNRKTGPRPDKFNAVLGALTKDIDGGVATAEELRSMTEKELMQKYKTIKTRYLARKAHAALSEFVAIKDSDK